MLNRSPIAFLVPEIMAHHALHNVVSMITFKKSGGADKDLGVGGTVTPVVKLITPEPHVNAIKIDMVQKSGGLFRFSDNVMTIARQSITYNDVLDLHTEWDVNGERFETIAVTPGPSAWSLVIRRKTTAPVTP